jgi:chemotaxis protein CheD
MAAGTASAAKVAPVVKDDGIAPAPGRRFHDSVTGTWMVKVFPGEYYITTKSDETIVTILGSCVAACIRDPVIGIGGMNHFMLPHDATDHWGGDLKSTRYGNFAMEKLLNELIKAGAKRERLEIKVFGGGNVVAGLGSVGHRNADFIESYLASEGLRAVATHLRGSLPRLVQYVPRSGRARMRELTSEPGGAIFERERLRQPRVAMVAGADAVELFD